MRTIVALLLLVGAIALGRAETAAFTFGGERFVKKFEVRGLAPNQQVEFGLENETLEGWTSLVTLHSFVRSGNVPANAAANLANVLRQRYPGSPYKIATHPKTSETIIDFMIPANADVLEFNVFKYAPAGGELVALQFARRIKFRDMTRDEMAAIRQRALDEIADYEISAVKAYFGKER
jgi:hypothetical protein